MTTVAATCALLPGAAFAAADLTATVVDGRLEVPQVFAGEGYQAVALVNESARPVTFALARLLSQTSAAGLWGASTNGLLLGP